MGYGKLSSHEEADDPLYTDRRNFYKGDKSSKDGQRQLRTICSLRFGVETIIKPNWKGPIMKRLIVATLVGQTIAVSLSTSASAFRCLARSSNGVNTWGYGIFFSRAAHFAVRHCRVAGGIDCHVAYCRWGAQDNQLYNRRYGLMGYSRLCFKQRS